MLARDWAESLQCGQCGGAYESSEEALTCNWCEVSFPVVDGIPVLLQDETTGTSLEKIDYDKVHGIDEKTVERLAEDWSSLLKRQGLEPEAALEIGAGTGALSLALLKHAIVKRLTATDVSLKFLRMLAARAGESETPLSLVVCDANEPHFKPESFDLVAGRSILHHLLDYPETLKQAHAMLKEGGAAIFFEPVIEGKAIVSLLMGLILRSEEYAGSKHFTPEERQKIRKQIRHQTKSKWYPQNRESLARLEDKYIFEIDRLIAWGRALGFRRTEFENVGEVKPSYWPHVVQTFRIMGIPPQRIAPFKWIGEEFADTYGLLMADRMVRPMGYFVFRK